MTEAALATAGVFALTEGVKFLYAQAGEALKWWRERKDRKDAAATTEEVAVAPPAEAFPQASPTVELDANAVENLEAELRELRKELSGYADGVDRIDLNDSGLLEEIDALRLAVEAVTHRTYTFAGEERAVGGPVVTGTANVDEVKGYVAGLRAKRILSGQASGMFRATTVAEKAVGVGTDADTVGG